MTNIPRPLPGPEIYEGILDLGIPEDVRGWHSNHPIFSNLISEIKPSVIVEVGTWKGASAIHMATLSRNWVADDAKPPYEVSGTPVRDMGPKIYCCDTWLGGIDHDLHTNLPENILPRDKHGYPTLYHTFLSNVARAGFQNRIVPVAQTSSAAIQLLAAHGVKTKLAYIDAGHSKIECIMDIDMVWTMLLEPGGIVFGDDFGWSSVAEAVGDFATHTGALVEVISGNFWFLRKP